MSRRLFVLRILKHLLPHTKLVEVFKAILPSIIDYSSAVFVNPGKLLDSRIRAYKIIHGNEKVVPSVTCAM